MVTMELPLSRLRRIFIILVLAIICIGCFNAKMKVTYDDRTEGEHTKTGKSSVTASSPDGEATRHPPPIDVPFLINNPSICNGSSRTKYIVYVHSAPDLFARREAVRSTWFNTTFFHEGLMKGVFVMGRAPDKGIQEKIESEVNMHRDIIQGDFVDSYRNLTIKGVMALKWVSTYCSQTEFVIKTDDDAFINVFKLVQLLQRHKGEKRTIHCAVWEENTMPILRNTTNCGKWCIDKDEFPNRSKYPRYCSGLAYIMSSDVPPLLYNISRTTPFFWVDDVYIMGLLPRRVKDIQYVNFIKYYTLNSRNVFDELKNISKPLHYIFTHESHPKLFHQLWQLLLARYLNANYTTTLQVA